MNLDQVAEPSKNIKEVANLIKNDPTLKDMYVKGGKPILKLGKNFNRIDKFGAVSSDVEFLKVNHVEFYIRVFESFYKLYQTIGHELTHTIQITSNRYNQYYQKYGSANARDYMEYEAWSWNYSMNNTDSYYLRVAKHFKNQFDFYK